MNTNSPPLTTKEFKFLPLFEQVLIVLRMIIMLLAMIVLLWLFANQIQEYFNGAELLETPCNLCVKLNPELEPCIMRTPITNNQNTDYKINFSELKINPI